MDIDETGSNSGQTALEIDGARVAGVPNSKARKHVASAEGVYDLLSLPFTGIDAANDALKGFVEAVSVARREYGIPDVLITVQMVVQEDDGRVGRTYSHMTFGDSLRAQAMAAYAFGAEEKGHDARIRELLGGKRR